MKRYRRRTDEPANGLWRRETEGKRGEEERAEVVRWGAGGGPVGVFEVEDFDGVKRGTNGRINGDGRVRRWQETDEF